MHTTYLKPRYLSVLHQFCRCLLQAAAPSCTHSKLQMLFVNVITLLPSLKRLIAMAAALILVDKEPTGVKLALLRPVHLSSAFVSLIVAVVQGIYGDLVPAWYAQVGQSLTIVIVFTVGLPHPAYVLYR